MKHRFVKISFICWLALIFAPVHAKLIMRPVINELPASWAIAVSPEQQLWVSNRKGTLRRYTLQGELVGQYALDLPDLYYKGQGGLMAIAFPPDYAKTKWVYLSYSFGSDAKNGLKVIRVQVNDNPQQTLIETIFEQEDLRDTPVHYGARIAFLQDASLLVSIGDGFDYREQAQKDNSQLGKILQIFPDKVVSTYSKGHRNAQAFAVLDDGSVFSHEHGPDGGDEINLLEKSVNYGWPIITFGKDYIGGRISPFTEYPNMRQADFDWTPSIAPSGMIYYANDRFAELSNTLLVTSLKFQQMHSVKLTNEQAIKKPQQESIYFAKSGYRLRDITQSSNGRIFILGDGSNASIFEVMQSN
jgi:glucose/arabinose dehydrogenase